LLALQVFECLFVRLLERPELGGEIVDFLLSLVLLLLEIIRRHQGKVSRILCAMIIHDFAGVHLLKLLHLSRDIAVAASSTGSL
jgi:hypothetical protein